MSWVYKSDIWLKNFFYINKQFLGTDEGEIQYFAGQSHHL